MEAGSLLVDPGHVLVGHPGELHTGALPRHHGVGGVGGPDIQGLGLEGGVGGEGGEGGEGGLLEYPSTRSTRSTWEHPCDHSQGGEEEGGHHLHLWGVEELGGGGVRDLYP